jgi:transposase
MEIGLWVLSRWRRQFGHDGQQAFPGKGHLKSEDEELRRLTRECERLRRECDILKKALAIFSEDPL